MSIAVEIKFNPNGVGYKLEPITIEIHSNRSCSNFRFKAQVGEGPIGWHLQFLIFVGEVDRTGERQIGKPESLQSRIFNGHAIRSATGCNANITDIEKLDVGCPMSIDPSG